MNRQGARRIAGGLAVVVLGLALVTVARGQLTSWSTGQKIDTMAGNNTELNTTALDGCPIQSRDGLSLYIASTRPGGLGGIDIWVARRARATSPWGGPENLGEPVNSAADDFCPTPVGRGGLFFVSREALPGSCGQGDIYYTSRNPAGRWREPQRLACAPNGPNTPLDEQGPSFVDLGKRHLLYFSTSSVTPAVAGDVFVTTRKKGKRFGPAIPVAALNDATGNDIQPNVRRDGLEVVFSSNRAGGAGTQDIWASSRTSVNDPWSAPVNLGASINTAAGESRPSLSSDGRQLLFGRAPGPEGSSDIYVSTR